jgi:signal transduction histidine kinase/CheY-like chemotaxis protein
MVHLNPNLLMPAKFYRKIIEAGAANAKDEANAAKIKYLNYCLFFGIVLFIPNVIYEACLRLPYTVAVDSVFIALVIITYFINIKGYYNTARSAAIISANFVLVSGNYAEGLAAGNYLIFIPLFFVFSILGKLKDNFAEVIFLILLTSCSLIVSLFFFPEYSTIQDIPLPVVKAMFKANFFIALFLTMVFSYLIYNITQKNEAQLTKAKELAEESAKAKLQFLSNMSHELRTPLNGIIGTTNLLHVEEHNQQQKEHYDLLKFSSSQMLNLVNDVLDFSKIESGKIELEERKFNLETFIKNIYNSFAQQFESKGLYFKLATDDDLNINIISDDIRLSQILNNLLSNALKFTHTGGVTLSVKINTANKEKATVAFSISDTGIGIHPLKINTVFESFMQADLNTTRKYGGTGLGLSISKKLTEVFNSSLNVQSEVNKGSTFYFDIIFIKNENNIQVTETVNESVQSLSGLNVLIAEDNKINMLIARKFLIKWGVILTEAINGKEAIAFCKKNTYDIILLDLEMPEADGYTALQEIRKIHPTTPAIAFTAATFENIEAILTQKGFTDYILKPFVPHELNAKLYKYL